ncbi:hypothetical protein [Hydrogenophaga sp. 5NK40-0174]|uniref:hypothetical protein n=1 Tax=Hydrogenophaga sp. 5NK40-0174 TaxID=3127649 RepID=UPI00310272A0
MMFQDSGNQDELSHYELWYSSKCRQEPDLHFPCDDHGVVDLDSLSEKDKADYLFARALVGRDYAPPTVVDLDKLH